MRHWLIFPLILIASLALAAPTQFDANADGWIDNLYLPPESQDFAAYEIVYPFRADFPVCDDAHPDHAATLSALAAIGITDPYIACIGGLPAVTPGAALAGVSMTAAAGALLATVADSNSLTLSGVPLFASAGTLTAGVVNLDKELTGVQLTAQAGVLTAAVAVVPTLWINEDFTTDDGIFAVTYGNPTATFTSGKMNLVDGTSIPGVLSAATGQTSASTQSYWVETLAEIRLPNTGADSSWYKFGFYVGETSGGSFYYSNARAVEYGNIDSTGDDTFDTKTVLYEQTTARTTVISNSAATASPVRIRFEVVNDGAVHYDTTVKIGGTKWAGDGAVVATYDSSTGFGGSSPMYLHLTIPPGPSQIIKFDYISMGPIE